MAASTTSGTMILFLFTRLSVLPSHRATLFFPIRFRHVRHIGLLFRGKSLNLLFSQCAHDSILFVAIIALISIVTHGQSSSKSRNPHQLVWSQLEQRQPLGSTLLVTNIELLPRAV